MFVFDLQCCFLHLRLSTDGFNCDFAGMRSPALKKTINTLAHNTMCLWVAEHMERLVGVERAPGAGLLRWSLLLTNGVKGVP